MKRFLIHVSTNWCGMDDTFRAVADNKFSLYDIGEQLAYDNFDSYGCYTLIAEEWGYDPDEMEEADWDELWEKTEEADYYSFYIEEFEGDEKNGKITVEKSTEKTKFYNRMGLRLIILEKIVLEECLSKYE